MSKEFTRKRRNITRALRNPIRWQPNIMGRAILLPPQSMRQKPTNIRARPIRVLQRLIAQAHLINEGLGGAD